LVLVLFGSIWVSCIGFCSEAAAGSKKKEQIQHENDQTCVCSLVADLKVLVSRADYLEQREKTMR